MSYETLSADALHSITWASTGGDGSGKSWFGLTAPSPLFVCAFDPYGMNRVDPTLKVGRDIRIARYPFNATQYDEPKKVAAAAETLWKRFRTDYDWALANCKTVLWDREDLMWELLRFARFGAQGTAPKEYAPLYLEYAWLVQKAQAAGVNLGVLRGIRDKWISKFDPQKQKMVPTNTGEKVPDGMNKIADHVDITLAHRWDSVQKAYITKIEKFTNPDEKDMEYPNLTFADMAMLAYPDTSAADWE